MFSKKKKYPNLIFFDIWSDIFHRYSIFSTSVILNSFFLQLISKQQTRNESILKQIKNLLFTFDFKNELIFDKETLKHKLLTIATFFFCTPFIWENYVRITRLSLPADSISLNEKVINEENALKKILFTKTKMYWYLRSAKLPEGM